MDNLKQNNIYNIMFFELFFCEDCRKIKTCTTNNCKLKQEFLKECLNDDGRNDNQKQPKSN